MPPQLGVGKRTEKEQCLRARREEDSGAPLIYVTVPAFPGLCDSYSLGLTEVAFSCRTDGMTFLLAPETPPDT